MHYVDMAKLYSTRQQEIEGASRLGEDAPYSNEAMGLLSCRIVVRAALEGDMVTSARFRARMKVHAAITEGNNA